MKLNIYEHIFDFYIHLFLSYRKEMIRNLFPKTNNFFRCVYLFILLKAMYALGGGYVLAPILRLALGDLHGKGRMVVEHNIYDYCPASIVLTYLLRW